MTPWVALVSLIVALLWISFYSMESIDKIGQHEKFLAKNFESLDGEEDAAEGAGESPNHKNRYCQGTGAIYRPQR